MYENKIKSIFIFCSILLVLTACMQTPGPGGWVPTIEKAKYEVYGAWTVVNQRESRNEGELIAAENSMIYLLTSEGLIQIPVSEITSLTIVPYKENKTAALVSILGFVSTLSHGGWLIISAPIWLISGILNARTESASGILNRDTININELKKFARFPQGIPAGIDIQSLKPKLWW